MVLSGLLIFFFFVFKREWGLVDDYYKHITSLEVLKKIYLILLRLIKEGS